MSASSNETKENASPDNVVEFRPRQAAPEPDEQDQDLPVWTCAHCRCMTFYLRADASTECAHCRHVGSDADDGAWRKRLPDPPAEVPVSDSSYNIVANINSPERARAAWLKRATEPGADPVFLGTIQRDGSISMWTEGAETADGKSWFASKFDRLKQMVLEAGGGVK